MGEDLIEMERAPIFGFSRRYRRVGCWNLIPLNSDLRQESHFNTTAFEPSTCLKCDMNLCDYEVTLVMVC